MLVVLDPGHGGKDPGAVRAGIVEKDIALSIARVVKGQLAALGHKVIMTRNDDTFLSPKQRTDIANAQPADLFVSIHCNSTLSLVTTATGVETLYYPENTKAFVAATLIQREVVGATHAFSRGSKPRTNVWVVKHTRMPSVLIECGFVSNPSDAGVLNMPEYRRTMGQAITSGIIHYFK